jgi:uncharacterized membrane protein YhaH (DUF805 family)
MQWYLIVLNNYIGFQGRASRKEYWMFFLINVSITIFLSILEAIVNLPSILTGLYFLAVLLPSLAVCVRRIHDTGRSAWWLLISFIPLVGGISLLVFMCQDSQGFDNQYGLNPKSVA